MLPVPLKPYPLILRNRFTKSERASQNKRRDILLGLCAAITMFCIFVSTCLVLDTVRVDPLLREAFPVKIIQLTFGAFLFMLLVSATLSTIGNLFTAENMDLLLYTPVRIPSLYISKASATLAETGIMYFVFSTPVALGLVAEGVAGPLILVHGFLVSVPFLLIPVGLSFPLAALFARVSAWFWRRGSVLFAALGAAVLGLFYKLVPLLNELKFDEGGAAVLAQALRPLANPNPAWSPAHWAADVVIDSFVRRPSAVYFFILLYGCAALALFTGYLVTRRFLLPVRSAVISQERPVNTGRGIGSSDLPRRVFQFFCSRMPVNPQLSTIILKDLTSLTRDRGQALQLLMYLGIASAYILLFRFMAMAARFSPTGGDLWTASLASLNLLLSGFMLTTVLTRLIYPSVSLEGRSFWIVLISPLRLSQLICAKFLCWLPLAAFVAVTLSAAGLLAIGFTGAKLIVTASTALALACGGTGLAVGIGAMFASFEWESPNQISAGLGTLVLLLSNLLLVALTSAPASLLIMLADCSTLRQSVGSFSPLVVLASALLILGLNIGAAAGVCRLGTRALAEKSR